MAKENAKFDPNTEAFQLRAQWKKAANCQLEWKERWSWLLDENKRVVKEVGDIRREAAKSLPQVAVKAEFTKSLKPVPVTSTGFIGWISTKPDNQLEIYTPWLQKIPYRQPDAWEYKNYMGPPQYQK